MKFTVLTIFAWVAFSTLALLYSHPYHPSPECSYISGRWWIHSPVTHVITGQGRNPRLISLPIFSFKLAAWLLPTTALELVPLGLSALPDGQVSWGCVWLCPASGLYHLGSCFSVLSANLLCYFCNTFSLGFSPASWVFWCLLLAQKLIPTP